MRSACTDVLPRCAHPLSMTAANSSSNALASLRPSVSNPSSASSLLAAGNSHQHASGDLQRAVVEPAHEIVGHSHRPITVG